MRYLKWGSFGQIAREFGTSMLSRRSALSVAQAYASVYTYRSTSLRSARGPAGGFKFYRDRLYDFLFMNEFPPWLLNLTKAIPLTKQRGLLEFIMRLHTGESVVTATKDWSWAKRARLGQELLQDLARVLICDRLENPSSDVSSPARREAVERMQRSLELDGHLYRDGLLLQPEESVLEEQEEEGLLVVLAHRLGLSDVAVVKHHLGLSVEHYEAGRWDDSIANSRKVLEALLSQGALLASALPGRSPVLPTALIRPVAVRDYLQDAGLLEKREKETIAACYGLLSTTGGHPYIAEKDQARLMRHLALTLGQFVLLRLEGAQRQASGQPKEEPHIS